jgi:hypothetical protein
MSRKKRERKERRRYEQHLQEVESSQRLLAKRAREHLKDIGEAEPILIRDPQGLRKMSEILLEFAEPFLNQVYSFEHQEKVIMLAALAWNLSLLGPLSRMLELRKIKKTLKPSDDPEFDQDFQFILQKLISRKKENYDDIKRLITDWQFVQTRQGSHLNVVSTVLKNSKPDQQGLEWIDKMLSQKEDHHVP